MGLWCKMNKDKILKRIQEEELKLLKEFREICEQNNLTYFALGGSLLGAVRHKGFIPWDDDMDLGLPRKDFERLLSDVDFSRYNENHVMEKSVVNLGVVQYKLNSDLEIDGRKYSVCIDIFPLDGVPNSKVERYYFEKNVLFYRMLYKLSVINDVIDKDRGLIENIIYKFAKYFKVNRMLSTNKINEKLYKIISENEYTNSINVGNILGRYREKEIVSKDMFGEGVFLDFEDIKINCPIDYDAYLKNIYGDYMKLPEKKDRIPHFEELQGKK